MKRKLSVLFLLLFSLILSSCNSFGSDSAGAESISVYRVLKETYQTSGALLSPEILSVSEDDDYLEKAIFSLNTQAGDARLQSAMPTGVSIISAQLDGDVLNLEMTPAYLALTGIQKTIADYCITLTLCELADVSTVSLYVDGEAVTTGLGVEDAMLFDAEAVPYEKQVRLYFPVKDTDYLRSEYHTLTVDIDVPLERYIIEELLRGPYDSSLYSGIPSDTTLLSVTIDDKMCTVDFSDDFYYNRSLSKTQMDLAVYSIVNSLTSLSEISSVKILINGKSVGKYGNIDLDLPLVWNDDITKPRAIS